MAKADTEWVMRPISSRTTKRELEEIVSIMPPEFRDEMAFGGYVTPARKADLRDWINERRRMYWDRMHSPQPSKGAAVEKKDYGRPFAEVANEFLAELPLVDLDDLSVGRDIPPNAGLDHHILGVDVD